MKYSIGILLIFLKLSLSQRHDEIISIKVLTEQLMIALSHYLTQCESRPYRGQCLNTTNLQNDGQVKIIIWDPDGNILEEVSEQSPRSKFWNKFEKKFMLWHDFGESSCSTRMREMVRSIYKRRPMSLVTSLDYSSMVCIISEKIN